MGTVVWDGSIAYDGASDTVIIRFTDGVDVAWQEVVAVGAAIPIMSNNGIHSLIFGGQVITGCLVFAFIWSLTESILSGVI